MVREKTIRNKAVVFFWAIFLLGLSGGLGHTQETATITTYYPSPYGIYRNLRIVPGNITPTCNAANEGTLYFDNAAHRLYLCERLTLPTGGYGAYQWLGGAFWAHQPGNPNSIYAATTGSVGIGTNIPSAASPTNGQSGNLDANDVYVRSELKWMSQIGVSMPPPTSIWTTDSENANCPDNTYMCGFDCTGGCSTGSMRARCCYFN